MKPASNQIIGIALAFAAAWTDTVGFVALYGLFTAHVTGNFVIIGAAVVDPANGSAEPGGLLVKIAALPVFIVGAAIATVMVRRRQAADRPAKRLLLSIETLALATSLVAGCSVSSGDPGSVGIVVASIAAILAMGIQNAVGRLLFPQLSATTVMTVNVAQLSIDTVDLLRDPRGVTQGGREARGRAARLAPPVVAFAFAAIAAAFAYRSFGYVCLVVPVVLLGVLSRFVDSD